MQVILAAYGVWERSVSHFGGSEVAMSGEEDSKTAEKALLRGSESHVIGGISAISEGSAAISLSQGGSKKRYSHTDPNEDAAAFALSGGSVLLAVADGHNGCDAAEATLEELIQRADPILTSTQSATAEWWQKTALEVISAIQTTLVSKVAQGVRGHSRTTLALALVLPDEDLLAFASVGDSHIFRVCPDEVVDLAAHSDRARCFLGNPADDLASLAKNSVIGVEPIANTKAVVLATDGISESGIGVDVPEFTVAECAASADSSTPELRPLELARNVAEATLAAHKRNKAGDNIAVAVTCLPFDEKSASRAD
jgi:serine/threonine protein phosphatase PrpC